MRGNDVYLSRVQEAEGPERPLLVERDLHLRLHLRLHLAATGKGRKE